MIGWYPLVFTGVYQNLLFISWFWSLTVSYLWMFEINLTAKVIKCSQILSVDLIAQCLKIQLQFSRKKMYNAKAVSTFIQCYNYFLVLTIVSYTVSTHIFDNRLIMRAILFTIDTLTVHISNVQLSYWLKINYSDMVTCWFHNMKFAST